MQQRRKEREKKKKKKHELVELIAASCPAGRVYNVLALPQPKPSWRGANSNP